MHIGRETDYAIRILVALARQEKEDRLTSGIIGETMAIPPLMTRRVVARLAQMGLVKTRLGRNGGIRLARAPETITLREVVVALEPTFIIADCLLDPAICSLSAACPVHRQWARLQAMVLGELDRVTLADLAADSSSLSQVLEGSEQAGSQSSA